MMRRRWSCLEHPVAGVRRWTIRLLGDDHRMNRDLRAKLEALAADEPDAMVRSQLAVELPAMGAPTTHSRSWTDWSAMTRISRIPISRTRSGGHSSDNCGRIATRSSPCCVTADLAHTPLLRDAVLERVARALASDGSDGDFGALCPAAGGRARDRIRSLGILAGMEKGLEGRKLARTPAPLVEPLSPDLGRGAACSRARS